MHKSLNSLKYKRDEIEMIVEEESRSKVKSVGGKWALPGILLRTICSFSLHS